MENLIEKVKNSVKKNSRSEKFVTEKVESSINRRFKK